MLRRALLVVAALLLAGCNGAAPPATTTPPSAPAGPPLPPGSLEWITIDEHWPIPIDGARAAAAKAGYPAGDMGVVIRGEAAMGAVAGQFLAVDAVAAALLKTPEPPERGLIVLSPRVAERLGVAEGDELALRATAWPPSHVMAAFEMERVRPCDAQNSAALCSGPTNADGEAVLRLRVPPGSTDLKYHADVVELGPDDFPAFWNGTMISPSGRETRFSTAALERGVALPPDGVFGHVEPGSWTIRFTIDAGHKRLPGAIAGFITFRTLGFGSFDVDLLRVPDAAAQTRALLANATPTTATLRVSDITDVPGAGALLSLDDARALIGLGAGNATALVAPARGGDVRAGAEGSNDPAVGNLRVRLAKPAPAAPALQGALMLWAPVDVDLAALAPVEGGGAPALAVASWAPLSSPRIKERNVSAAATLLTIPDGPLPWRLVAGSHWKDEAALVPGIATTPHLVLSSSDLVLEVGALPTNATYLKTELDTGLGSRIVFTMGAVEGAPAGTVWASAALVSAVSAQRGARILVPIDEGADREAVEARALEAWAAHGVAALI